MAEYKAIETEYKGYRFRSRLEARWATFFDYCNADWEYEPEGYDLRDGIRYLPDFLVHNVQILANPEDYPDDYGDPDSFKDIYFEVKGNMTDDDREKIVRFHDSGHMIFVLGNVPDGNCLEEICQNISHQHLNSLMNNPKAVLFSGGLCNMDTQELLPCIAIGWGSRFSLVDTTSAKWGRVSIQDTMNAYNVAHAARFEHGESGGIASDGKIHYGDGCYKRKEGNLDIYGKEFWLANALRVEIGTTGFKGGDAGHGCKTYFSIEDLTGTCMDLNAIYDKFGNIKKIELELGGDCELSTFQWSLNFASEVLNKIIEGGKNHAET